MTANLGGTTGLGWQNKISHSEVKQMSSIDKPRRILRWTEVASRIPFSKSHAYALQAQGKFPKPVKLVEGGRGAGYWEHEIEAYLEQRYQATINREISKNGQS